MTAQIYINDILIDSNYVIEYQSFNESISFESSMTIPDSAGVILDDARGMFNPASTKSIFYGGGLYNSFRVYDAELAKYIFSGKITNILTENGRVEVEAKSDLSELAGKSCSINEKHITPADAILKILTESPTMKNENLFTIEAPVAILYSLVSLDLVSEQLFADASRYQKSKKCFVDVSAVGTESDNNTITVGDMINKLCKIGHCSIYTVGNIICLYQWRDNNGSTGIPITDAHIIDKSFKWSYAQDEAYKIYNKYRIAYDSGGSILFATDYDKKSVNKYGLSQYGIPEENVNSSGSDDYSIIIDNMAGATWCGASIISRFAEPTKVIEWETSYTVAEFKIGDEITLDFAPYTGWTGVITEREIDRESDKIAYKAVILK